MSAQVGEVLFKSEPFCCILSTENVKVCCDFCWKAAPNLLKCSQCKLIDYCDKNCQRLSWSKDLHKHECKRLKAYGKRPTDIDRMLARVLFRLKLANGYQAEEKVLNTVRRFEDLVDHYEVMKEDHEFQMNVQVTDHLLREYVGDWNLMPTIVELGKIYGKILNNLHTVIGLSEVIGKGWGVYLGGSCLNHSCVPNTQLSYEGRTFIVRASEPIPEIDISKIFRTYLCSQLSETAVRQSFLRKYHFNCNCSLCQNTELDILKRSLRCQNPDCKEPQLMRHGLVDSDSCPKCKAMGRTRKDLENANKMMSDAESDYDSILQLDDPSDVFARCEEILQKQDELLHWLNVYRITFVARSFVAAPRLDRWDKIVAYSKELKDAFDKYYDGIMPVILTQAIPLAAVEPAVVRKRLVQNLIPKFTELLDHMCPFISPHNQSIYTLSSDEASRFTSSNLMAREVILDILKKI